MARSVKPALSGIPNGTNDGGVHNLFVITGRTDAPGCNIAQPDFLPAGNPLTGQGGNPNIIFRIPTPVFGAGLIEAIPDSAILANMQANAVGEGGDGHLRPPQRAPERQREPQRQRWDHYPLRMEGPEQVPAHVRGRSLQRRDGNLEPIVPPGARRDPGLSLHRHAQRHTQLHDDVHGAATSNPAVISDIEAFANFMRMLAPPTPAPDTPSTVNGRAAFIKVGCAHCHTPSFTTGKMIASGSSTVPSAALSNQTVNLWSDLLVHHMGKGLADGITQGSAGPDEFRTAPLWGVGQRVFFLHDGRTTDLVEAIEDHKSQGSEADKVIERFNQAEDSGEARHHQLLAVALGLIAEGSGLRTMSSQPALRCSSKSRRLYPSCGDSICGRPFVFYNILALFR